MRNRHRATVAAIRAAYGQRLKAQNYRDLMDMHTIPEIVSYLKETPRYTEPLKQLEPALTRRGVLEPLLRRNVFDRCVRFSRMEQLHHDAFCRFFIEESELREIMKAIRHMTSENQTYISVMDAWLEPYLSISLARLARANSYADLLEVLAHTPYIEVLEPLLRTQTISYTACETALRSLHIRNMQDSAKKCLSGTELDTLENLIGEQVDLINIINAYRMKYVFQAPADTIEPLMIAGAGRLPYRMRRALYDTPNTAAFLTVLSETRYAKLLHSMEELPPTIRMEYAVRRLRYNAARSALHFHGHAAVSLHAIHVLDQVETENLITIIEGIRYGKTVSFLQPRLIYDNE